MKFVDSGDWQHSSGGPLGPSWKLYRSDEMIFEVSDDFLRRVSPAIAIGAIWNKVGTLPPPLREPA